MPVVEIAMLLLFLIFTIILIMKGTIVIQQSEEMVIERLGKYFMTLSPGLHFIIPIMDSPKVISWQTSYKANDILYVNYIKTDRILKEGMIYLFSKENTYKTATMQVFFTVEDSVKFAYSEYTFEKLDNTMHSSFNYNLANIQVAQIKYEWEQNYNDILEKVNETANTLGLKINNIVFDVIDSRNLVVKNIK